MTSKTVIIAFVSAGIFSFSALGVQQIILPQIETPRDLTTHINLANGGVIVAPDLPGYRDIAAAVRKRIRECCGGEYVISNQHDQQLEKDQVVIAVGNMDNNPVLESLFWNFYTYVTPAFPGEQGYVIETVFQPLPLLPDNNVVVIGASCLAAAKQAADSFMANLVGPEIPPSLRVVDADPPAENPIWRSFGGLSYFRELTECYHRSGDVNYLHKAIGVLDEFCSTSERNPGWVLTWVDEKDSYKAVCAWDFIQEFAGLSEADRLRYERFFLNLITRLEARNNLFGIVEPGPVAVYNHTAVPFAGMYTAARYYQAHYGFDMQSILDQADTYFDGQKSHYSVICDSPAYAMLSLRFCMAYYSMTGQYEYLDNGNARKLCEVYFAQMDNNGYLNGVGDIRPDEVIWPDPVWDVLDWRIGFPELFWFRKQAKLDEIFCRSQFHPASGMLQPNYLAGCRRFPMDEFIYDSTCRENPSLEIPFEKTFNKLQFRTFSENGGEHLLLDGFGRGRHGHYDTGAIISCTLDGYKFIVDSEYLLGKSSEHSMVVVVREGQSPQPVPPLAELTGKVDFEEGAYTATRISNYNHVTWDRHILWLKNRYFVVLDLLTPETPGRFRFDCIWKVLDRGMEEFHETGVVCRAPAPEDLVRDFDPVTFHLQGVDGIWRDHRTCEDEGKYWKIHQTKTRDMDPADRVSYQNLFYVEKTPSINYRPVRHTESVMRILSDQEAVVAVGSRKAGRFEMRADFVYASDSEVLLVNATSIKEGNTVVFTSASPETVWMKKNGDNAADPVFTLKELIVKNIPPETGRQKVGQDYPRLTPLWSTGGGLPESRNRDLNMSATDEDDNQQVLFCAGSKLFCLDAEGTPVWEYENDSDIYSLLSVDGEEVKVLAGTRNGKILGLNASGKLVRSVDVPHAPSGKYGKRTEHWVTHLSKKDLNHDGKEEIIAGLRSWQVHVFDSRLAPLWYNSIVLHGVTNIAYGTVRRKTDLFYVGDIYGGAYAFDFSRDKSEVLLRRVRTSIGATFVAASDVDRDGVDDVIAASECGTLVASSGRNYKTLWSLTDYGHGYSGLRVVPGDGSLLAVPSPSGYIHIINASTGDIVNVMDAAEPISSLEIVDDRFIVGTDSGYLMRMDTQGNILSKTKVSGGVLKIRPCDSTCAVLTVDGQVSLFPID